MYCSRCQEERGPTTRFCVACGGGLEERPREALQRDLGQNLFLVEALEQWEKRGDLAPKFVKRLGDPYRARIERLEASLKALSPESAFGPSAEKARELAGKIAQVAEAEPATLPPRVEPRPGLPVIASTPVEAGAELPAIAATPIVEVAQAAAPMADAEVVREARLVLPVPLTANELSSPPPPPAKPPLPMELASDAVALASGALEGPLALGELGAPKPRHVEQVVERESTWSTVWKPFLYDNAIWFVGAFCIVSGSLYVASQAYEHVGDVARSLIVMSMMTVYAAGFVAAGFMLGERKGLTSAGRILSLIGAAVSPVALLTLEPLRGHAPALFGLASLIGIAVSAGLLKVATDRFDDRLSLRIGATGLVLLAWEVAVPWAATEPSLASLVPLLALFSATGVLRKRDPQPENVSLAFSALALLYLAAFDVARLHYVAATPPGLELYGPLSAALGWIALRADRARLGKTEAAPKIPATTLAALALVVVGALASLVAESSAAAAALIATLAFADAARTYRRAPFVAVASFLGLFAYYLSPDLIPHGVQAVLAAARHALGYAQGQSLPVAFAGISTVPYLLLLGIVARRAHAKQQPWLYRPIAWTGVVLTVLLTVVAHSSVEVRPGLWSSIALVLMVGAALWLADHAAAGYLFGYIAALLGYDLARSTGGGDASFAFAMVGAGLALLVLSRVAPERQRTALIGESLLLAILAPVAVVPAWGSVSAAIVLAASVVHLALLALQTRSRLPAFLGSLVALAAVVAGLQVAHPGWAKPALLAVGFVALLAAGPAWRAPEGATASTRPFGLELPWLARGFDLFRDPLALLGTGLVLLSVAPIIAWLGLPSPADRVHLAIAALFPLLLARRYALGWLSFGSVGLATLACLGSWPALAILGLGCAALAVLFTQVPAAARLALRSTGLAAELPFALAALLLPLGLIDGAHAGWLMLSAASYLLLLRWRPVAALWLPLAALAAWWSTQPFQGEELGRGAAAISLAFAVLGLLGAMQPAAVRKLLGVDGAEVKLPSAIILVTASVFAVLELLVSSHRFTVAFAPAIAPALAMLTCAYLMLAHQTRHAVPLYLAGLLGFSAAAASFPHSMVAIFWVGALALAVLANLARVFTVFAEPILGPRPARTSGYALALAALSLFFVSVAWGLALHVDPSHFWEHAAAPLWALTLFLSARALGWAPLHPVALALFAGDLLVRGELHHGDKLPVAIGVCGAGLVTLAILTRRLPAAMAMVFVDRPPERGRASTLRWTFLVTMLLAAAAMIALAADRSLELASTCTAIASGLLALSVLAAPGAAWWLFAAIGAVTAATLRDGDQFRPAFAVLNALLALSGLLELRSVRELGRRLFRATDAAGNAPRTLSAYGRALSAVVAWSLFVGGLAMAGTVFQRLDVRHAISSSGAVVALLLPVTGVHLLFRRRGPWALALAFALPVLPALYLSERELVAPAIAVLALPYAAVTWLAPTRMAGHLLTLCRLALPLRRRKAVATLAFGFVVGLTLAGLAATELELGAWQTPVTAGLLTVALTIASLRQPVGRVFALALLPATAHLALAWVGVKLDSGRPHEAILGAWALAGAILALGAERFARTREERKDVLVAAHLYFALGALELAGAISLMPGMKGSELLFAGLAAALLGTFAALRALETNREVYAYLAQGALVALYLLVRLQTDAIGHRADRDSLSTILLGFAFLGLHALAKRLENEVFDRPTAVVTHLVPLVGLLFLPQLSTQQCALYGLGLALHFAAVSATLGGSKPAAVLSAVALNLALAVTWMDRGINDPQFYAIPLGATLLAFARLFRNDLSPDARFWMRTVGILSVYVASASSALYFARAAYVMICAAVCIGGVLLGVMLRVRSYVYLGTAFLVVDVLGNMARFGLQEKFFGGVMLTLLGIALVGGWIFFLSKREELMRRYAAVQALMREWE